MLFAALVFPIFRDDILHIGYTATAKWAMGNGRLIFFKLQLYIDFICVIFKHCTVNIDTGI